MAYYYAINDNQNTLSEDKLALMYQRAVSAYWKMIKKTHTHPYFHWGFIKYLQAKLLKIQPNLNVLQKMYDEFVVLKNIRR